MKTDVLLIGNGAREHAITLALARSKPRPNIFAYMKANNLGIAALAEKTEIGPYHDPFRIVSFAKAHDIKLAIIGPEEPLAYGVADALENMGIPIPTVGPRKALAKLETSKSFTRRLLLAYHIPGNPKFGIFSQLRALADYLADLFSDHRPFVLKPDGLTGGKGVMIQGDHFNTLDQAIAIGQQMLEEHHFVIVEDKLDGEEFSLKCFCDGITIVPCPPVQDHKRRLVGDRGLNTGGMGSYSCADHLLPFLTPSDLDQAVEIIRRIIGALYIETGQLYKGIIYGGFMVTADGVRLLECNARFGDPEAINVLSLLETDFLDICRAIITGTLDEIFIKFKHMATVVKYVVPVNYGLTKEQQSAPKSDLIQIGDLGKAALYYSSVNSDAAGCHLTSSRAVAVLGMSPDLAEAEKIAEQGACAITGAVDHRSDIGTAALIQKRVRHMEELRPKEQLKAF